MDADADADADANGSNDGSNNNANDDFNDDLDNKDNYNAEGTGKQMLLQFDSLTTVGILYSPFEASLKV